MENSGNKKKKNMKMLKKIENQKNTVIGDSKGFKKDENEHQKKTNIVKKMEISQEDSSSEDEIENERQKKTTVIKKAKISKEDSSSEDERQKKTKIIKKAKISKEDSSSEDERQKKTTVIKKTKVSKEDSSSEDSDDEEINQERKSDDDEISDSDESSIVNQIPEGEELSDEEQVLRIQRDWKKMEENDSDSSSSDPIGDDELDFESLDKFYSQSERAIKKSDGKVERITDITRDLNNKVYNIDTENDYDEEDKLQMPPTGVLVNGVPFHHLKPYPLEEKHIRRLYAHGIVYKTCFFSPAEDRQLVINWKRYAEKYNLDFEDAPIYMGWAKHLDGEKTRKIREEIVESNLHGYMCVNLIDRCAIQVRRRCYRLFNPKDDEWKTAFLRMKKFTKDEDKKLLELHELLGDKWQEIGFKLKRNRFDVQKRYVELVEGRYHKYGSQKTRMISVKEFTNEVLKELYDEVKNYMSIHPVQLIATNDLEKMAKEEDGVNWLSVGHRMKVFPDICKEKWKEIKKMIKNAYEKIGDSEAGVTRIEKEAFPPSVSEPKTRNMKLGQLQESLKITVKLAKEQQITELFEIDIGELTKRIKNAGINFHTVLTYGSKVIFICHRVLNSLRKVGLLSMLPHEITVIELIEMLYFFAIKANFNNLLALNKNQLMKLINDYLESKGYEPNPNYVLIYKEQIEKLKNIELGNNSKVSVDESSGNESEDGSKSGNSKKSSSSEDDSEKESQRKPPESRVSRKSSTSEDDSEKESQRKTPESRVSRKSSSSEDDSEKESQRKTPESRVLDKSASELKKFRKSSTSEDDSEEPPKMSFDSPVILYGTETGTARDASESLVEMLRACRLKPRLFSFDDFPFEDFPKEKILIFVISTSGQGQMPSNARKNWRYLLSKNLENNLFKKTKFAIAALGDSSYMEFNFAGKKLFRRLLSLGGVPLMDLGLCDDQHEQGMDFGFEIFKKNLEKNLKSEFKNMIEFDENILLPPKYNIRYLDEMEKNESIFFENEAKNNKKSSEIEGYKNLKVKNNQKVTADGHFQDTFLITFENSSFSYKPGDIAQIQPENLDEVIQVAVEALELSEDQLEKKFFLEKSDEFLTMPSTNLISYPTTLSKCFKTLFDVNALPTRQFFKLLFKLSDHEMEKERLKELSDPESLDDFIDYVRIPRRSISEVLRDFQNTSKKIPINRYFEIFPTVRSRSFSICSSYLNNSNTVEIIVARVELKRKKMKSPKLGLCSNYLARLKKEDTVSVRIQEGTMDFDTPEGFTKICIATGTGIAPFRNLILESKIKNDPYPIILFFGCRGRNLDNYFGNEWENYGNTIVFQAFSRDQERKIYVQHLMKENSFLLKKLILSKRVNFYIAGSSGEMPKAIRSALKSIIEESKLSDNPDEMLAQMELQKLIQFETWF